MQIGPAYGTGLDAQPNFPVARHRIVPVDRLQGRPDLTQLHRSHDVPKPPSRYGRPAPQRSNGSAMCCESAMDQGSSHQLKS
jgi:hypothetical protein